MGEYEAYVTAWRNRLHTRQARLDERREHHLVLAQTVAKRLRSWLGASRVYVFGSLADGIGYDENSDIDLAVEGIPLAKHADGWDIVEAICEDVAFDLVFLEGASEALRRRIVERGVELTTAS